MTLSSLLHTEVSNYGCLPGDNMLHILHHGFQPPKIQKCVLQIYKTQNTKLTQ